MVDLNPHVVTLGTAGGPRWWPSPTTTSTPRNGIATAVVVAGSVYLVDCGRGAGTQFAAAGFTPNQLRGIFLTHLHSDHTVDLANVLLFGWMMTGERNHDPIRVIGPGDRGCLPPVNMAANGPVTPLFADTPTAGTVGMIEHLFRAYSTDLADRMFDSLRPSPYTLFTPEDVEIPSGTGYDPDKNSAPEGMNPFEVYRDELVTVTAILVAHPPVAPAFAFRFDTAEGSVTISGDTAPCTNLVRLAQDTDLLLHEAIDFDRVELAYTDVEPSTAAATMEHHRKAHTSPRQAGQVAEAAGARSLALHHLVPGQTDPNVWFEAEETFSGPVFVPDDLEIISFAKHDLPSFATAEQA